MAVPKKRTSRSRRDKRRYAANKQLQRPSVIFSEDKNDWAIPHRFDSLEAIDAFLREKAKKKQPKKKKQ